MEDLFKKFVNAGVGFVSLTNDRVQKSIDALVKESKLSEKEGAKIMDDLKKNTDAKRKELEKQAQGLADRMLKTVGVAPNSELEELKRTKANSSTVARNSKSISSAEADIEAAAKKSSKSSKSTSKTAAKAKGAVASATSKAASTVKKAADKVSSSADSTQKSAAGSAGAAKKEENASS